MKADRDNTMIDNITESIIKRNGTSALNKKQASKELNIGVTKLDELRRNGEVRFTMIGGQVRINAYTIAEMIA